MRAVVISRPGGPEVLEVGDVEVRPPGPGEVRIQVAAAAVNPTDIGFREAGADDLEPPWIPGMDAAGAIESVGPGVERVDAGDWVMAAVNPRRPEGGAQVELLLAPVLSVVPIPEGATLAEASTLPMNGLTARLGLERLRLRSGATLAVTGGAGLLGSYVIGMARHHGLRVIADAKPEDEELVRSFGAHDVVPRGDSFADSVREIAPQGADGLYDTALLREEALPAIRDDGGIVVVRGWPGDDPDRGIEVHAVMVRDALERTDWLEELRTLATDGALELRVAGELPPEEAAEAHRRMDCGGLRGRVVIVF